MLPAPLGAEAVAPWTDTCSPLGGLTLAVYIDLLFTHPPHFVPHRSCLFYFLIYVPYLYVEDLLAPGPGAYYPHP